MGVRGDGGPLGQNLTAIDTGMIGGRVSSSGSTQPNSSAMIFRGVL